MKLNLGILFGLIVLLHDSTVFGFDPLINNPTQLFVTANDYQQRVTLLQEDIVNTIVSLRGQLSAVLKSSSNETLSSIQSNIETVFEMDAPVRYLIFVQHNTSTSCIFNLRAKLNTETEFSGFQSGICLARYDRNVTSLLNEAYEKLSEYEGLISIVQMIVINAFSNRNIWTETDEIQSNFIDTYNTEYSAWQTSKAGITAFITTLEQNIAQHNAILKSCFDAVQEGLVPIYEDIAGNRLDVCLEFDQ
jgi:hypothetical protein